MITCTFFSLINIFLLITNSIQKQKKQKNKKQNEKNKNKNKAITEVKFHIRLTALLFSLKLCIITRMNKKECVLLSNAEI
jgi:hypothetical protein